MKVIILCGGQGARLREETEYRPKPLVEVGNRPILWHIMKSYAYFGFTEFILCLGYRGSLIKEYFLSYKAANNDFTIELGHKQAIKYHGNGDQNEYHYHVTLADTGLDTMTGSRIKRIEKYIDTETFMVAYGDGVSNVDIAQLVAYHKKHGRLATVTTVRPPSRYGTLEFNNTGKVTSFAEKPKLDGWVSAGFFVFNRRVLDYLQYESSCVLEHEPLERLSQEGELMAYRHDGFFYAMDTYREYLFLNEMWNHGKAPWKVWK